MASSCYDKNGRAAEGSVFSYGGYGKVRYEEGLRSMYDTHKQTHLGHKTSFLRVDNMRIFGTKKWIDCLQNCRFAACMNGILSGTM
jgi:hypothetical protein